MVCTPTHLDFLKIFKANVEAHSQQHETVEDDLFFFSFFFKENIQVMDQMLGLVTFAQRCILC